MKLTNTIKTILMSPSSGIRHPMGALALFVLALAPVPSLQAEVLVSYDMQTYGARTNASSVHASVTASPLTGNFLNSLPGTLENPEGEFYTTWSPRMGGGSSAADALFREAYFELTVTPVAGEPVTIESLSFKVFAATAGPSARQLYVFSEKTGYEEGNELFTASTMAGSTLIPYNTSPGQPFSINLSRNKAFTKLKDSVTFRVYVQTPTEGQSLAFSDITIEGRVSH